MPVIYLDVCCLNRPFDDQTQPRIRLESEAILLILARVERSELEWVGSDVVNLEVSRDPDSERRRRILALASHVCRSVTVSRTEMERARQIEVWRFSAYDALHVACAESGGADVFLTTDDQLLRVARSHARQLRVLVENPLAWLEGAG